MKRLMIVFGMVLLLSGCPGYMPEGESIEDCIERKECQYSDKDVRTEGSDFAIQLQDLIEKESHDLTFSYSIDHEGQTMRIVYSTDEILTADNIRLFEQIYPLIIDVIDTNFDIDHYYITIEYKYVRLSHTYLSNDPEQERIENTAYIEYLSDTEITEEELLEYIDNHKDTLLLLLQENSFDFISFYSASYRTNLGMFQREMGYELYVNGVASNDAVIASITQVLNDNGYTIISPDTTSEDTTSEDTTSIRYIERPI